MSVETKAVSKVAQAKLWGAKNVAEVYITAEVKIEVQKAPQPLS